MAEPTARRPQPDADDSTAVAAELTALFPNAGNASAALGFDVTGAPQVEEGHVFDIISPPPPSPPSPPTYTFWERLG